MKWAGLMYVFVLTAIFLHFYLTGSWHFTPWSLLHFGNLVVAGIAIGSIKRIRDDD